MCKSRKAIQRPPLCFFPRRAEESEMGGGGGFVGVWNRAKYCWLRCGRSEPTPAQPWCWSAGCWWGWRWSAERRHGTRGSRFRLWWWSSPRGGRGGTWSCRKSSRPRLSQPRKSPLGHTPRNWRVGWGPCWPARRVRARGTPCECDNSAPTPLPRWSRGEDRKLLDLFPEGLIHKSQIN